MSTRYHSRFFQQLPHQMVAYLSGKWHFFIKKNVWQIKVRLAGVDWKILISDFQSQFSMSKIIQIFLKKFFIEEYQFRGIFVIIDIFWKLQFLNHFVTKIMPIFQSPPAKRTLICQKNIFMKKCYFPLN